MMKLATSYFGNRIPRHVRQDLQALRALGFDRVIHTFCENDLAFYPGTLREIVAISHDAGLEVQLDPWGVARIFGGEAFSRWIVEDEDLCQRGPSGRRLAGACLNHPRLRERMREWIEAAARTGARWVFWDEPHWVHRGPGNPEGEPCVCRHCLDRGGDLRAAPPETVERFRAESILRLLGELVRGATDAGLGSSVCVLPLDVSGQPALDWDAIARLPGVGEFGTDPYWQAFRISGADARDRFIDLNCEAARRACRAVGIPCMLWLQAFRIPQAGEADLFAGTRKLLAHRPETVAIWGFEACAHMSELAAERPAVVWPGLIELFHESARGRS
jgi:hypothetical protein